MQEAYEACIKVCPIWKDIYTAPKNSRKNMKHRNGILNVQNLNKQWRLVLPSTFNAEDKNFLEIAIAEAHAATVHCGIKKAKKALTDNFECQSFSRLVREYVRSCDICQRTKYLQKGPIGYVIPLYVPVRSWSDITMDFLKLLSVFTKCSVSYPNTPVGEDHIVCISQLWTIVDRQSGFKFLIPVPDHFSAEQCTTTFDTHVVPTMGYPYYIVFDQDTLLMSSHFQIWAASKRIKLEPSTA